MQSGPGPHERTAQKLAADGSDDWREGSFKLLAARNSEKFGTRVNLGLI